MKKSLGFTLLELLVVISIIGILVAVGTTSYSTAQKKSRDARRRGDMKAVQSAFEQYYAREGAYDTDCATMADAETLPAGLPSDPKPTEAYVFNCSTNPNFDYCACGQLENEAGNSDDTDCTYDKSGDESYYCVSNLQ